MKNTFASEVFNFLHQKLLCYQSTHFPYPKIASEGTPFANYSVKIKYFQRIRLLRTLLFENEQLNSLQNLFFFRRNTAAKCIKNSLVFLRNVYGSLFFTTTVYGLRFDTTGFGPRSEKPTPQNIRKHETGKHEQGTRKNFRKDLEIRKKLLSITHHLK